MMGHPLEGIKLKVARAAEHLEVLGREGAAYLDSGPYEIVGQARPESGTLLVCKVHRHPPLQFSILLGDFLHNLRSSLDHLAWQLVLANNGTPGVRTTFPILEKKRKGSIDIAGGVSTAAAALVEGFQPYNNKSGSPREHPLWILSKLNNIDKHRQFNIAVLNTTDVVQVDLLTKDGTGIYMTLQFPNEVGKNKPIEDGAAVGMDPFPARLGQKLRVGVFSMVGLQETEEVGPFGSLSVFAVAEQLLDYIRNVVISEFEQFFD